MSYDFGSSTVSPTAYTLSSVYGCGNTEKGQLQLSPDGNKLGWWLHDQYLAGFEYRTGRIYTFPLNATKTALNGTVDVKPISAAGNYGNGMLDFMKNNKEILYSQRGVYKEGNGLGAPNYDRNVWRYDPVNLSSLAINPNPSPLISYLFGEIRRGVDGNYYAPNMGKAADKIHSYISSGFNNFTYPVDTMYKLASSLPTQVFKVFDNSIAVKEFVRTVGSKEYELKDHLSNVRVTISDAKLISDQDGSNSITASDLLFPEVRSFSDLYPFGTLISGRQFNSGSYRYSFGGKEQDYEIKGASICLDFGARIYDSRISQWLSADPWASKYPWQSVYVSMDNNPINKIDPNGMGTQDWVKDKEGKIKWDPNATSKETTAKEETYLGKNVVEFVGSRNETLGKSKNGSPGYINGEGAILADVNVYGSSGSDDVKRFKGYTMSSDAVQFGAIDEGLYDANYDPKGKSGALKSNWTINKRGAVRMIDGKINPNAPTQVDLNGEGYKNGIFIHTSNANGFAGAFKGGAISTGCLLIVPKDWDLFNKAMEGVENFKVQVTREVPVLVPFESYDPVPCLFTIPTTLKTD